jgi:hypothetical protein
MFQNNFQSFSNILFNHSIRQADKAGSRLLQAGRDFEKGLCAHAWSGACWLVLKRKESKKKNNVLCVS